MQALLLHQRKPMSHRNNIKMDILDEAEVAAEVAATIREAEQLLGGVTSETIVKGTQGSTMTKSPHASSVAVLEINTLQVNAIAMCGVTNARLITMDHVRANGYRKQRTMARSFHIPPGGPLKNVWQFLLLPHMDFLRV